MRITTNERYSCWALLGIRNFWTCSKLSYRPAKATCMRRTLFELIVIVIVIARMTRNDHPNKLELSIRPHSAVDSAQWDWSILGFNWVLIQNSLVRLFVWSVKKTKNYTKYRIKISEDGSRVSQLKNFTPLCFSVLTEGNGHTKPEAVHPVAVTWASESYKNFEESFIDVIT